MSMKPVGFHPDIPFQCMKTMCGMRHHITAIICTDGGQKGFTFDLEEIGTWVTITDETTSHEKHLVKAFNLTLKFSLHTFKANCDFSKQNMHVFKMKI